MTKPTKEEIQQALGKLDTTMTSISFQGQCIEGELDGDEAEVNPETNKKFCLEDQWDTNDLDNWTSMEANLSDVRDLLKRML